MVGHLIAVCSCFKQWSLPFYFGAVGLERLFRLGTVFSDGAVVVEGLINRGLEQDSV